MDPDEPIPYILLSVLNPMVWQHLAGIGIMLALLICSALISGSEVAFFSLSPQDEEELNSNNTSSSDRVIRLLEEPKTLLATILIGNNLVNVAIIILSSVLMESMFDFEGQEVLAFVIQVVVVTLIILTFGEILPKIYATKNSVRLSLFMSWPLLQMNRLFSPLSRVLVRGTRRIDAKIQDSDATNHITVDELNHALELTTDKDTGEDEKRILSGIVKFGSTEVRQVMTPRVDVTCFEIDVKYNELCAQILSQGFSRIPVFHESFDNVKGVLYVKDLLPHLDEEDDFDWTTLLRTPYFITENKKLDDLLREFQEKKNHLAVVVDEYGGSSGIITLEDVIEEIVGEISDEFDEDELVYTKIDDNNFVFEGKTALIDMYRAMDIEGEEFETAKGDSDSLAGFILELSGKIPLKNERLKFGGYQFTIEAADKRRIKQVKVTRLMVQDDD